TLFLSDATRQDNAPAFVQVGSSKAIEQSPGHHNVFFSVPTSLSGDAFEMFAIGSDHHSVERGFLPLASLYQDQIAVDDIAPVVLITKPVEGVQTTRMARIPLTVSVSDNSAGLESLKLFDDRGYVSEIGGVFGQDTYNLIYDVPDSYRNGELNLSVVAQDRAGRSASHQVALPVAPNEVPQLAFKEFSSYKVNNVYRKVINTADRL